MMCRIQEKIKQIEHHVVPTGTIDITHFRDDIENSKKPQSYLLELHDVQFV
jgi:pyrimidine operon attenuation protein/uracil phosphoribosyltransferase